MKKNIEKDFIPVLFTIAIILVSIGIQLNTYIGLNYDFGLTYEDYLGVFLISFITFLYFWQPKWFAYIFGIFLLIGSFGFFHFFHIHLILETAFFKTNILFLIPLIMLIIFNKELKNLILPTKIPTEEEKLEEKAEKEIQIKNFERKFSSITESELKNIAEENSGYVDTARIASRNLLKRKYML